MKNIVITVHKDEEFLVVLSNLLSFLAVATGSQVTVLLAKKICLITKKKNKYDELNIISETYK